MFRSAIRWLVLALGFFEFFVLYRLMFDNPEKMHAELSYYPPQFFNDNATKYLSCTFTAFLGLIRIVWAAGNNSLLSWMGIVAAHFVEVVFLWSLAGLPHYDTAGSTNIIELAQKIQAGSIGKANVNFILLFVPILCLLLVIHGPTIKVKSKKTKEN